MLFNFLHNFTQKSGPLKEKDAFLNKRARLLKIVIELKHPFNKEFDVGESIFGTLVLPFFPNKGYCTFNS